MKIYLAQINPTVGDLCGNRQKILAALEDGETAGAELVVTPELALTGYPPQELLDRPDFIRAADAHLHHVAERVGQAALLVGAPWPNPGSGRPVFNSAVLVQHGEIVSWHCKSLLPTYDVFDEDRYFEPCREPKIARLGGRRLGITVCEDIWSESELGRRRYSIDPAARLVEAGAEVLINLAASPFELGKPDYRAGLVRELATRLHRPSLQVNLVGGNDSLVFDGSSSAWSASGEPLARIAPFVESGVLVDLDAPVQPVETPDMPEEAWAYHALVLGLSDYVRKCGFSDVLLGLSGGIDSALVCTLAAHALGPEHVLAVGMPSQFSSEGSVADSRELCERLGVEFRIIPVKSTYDAFMERLTPEFKGLPFDFTEENLQARVRGTLLMSLSNKFNSLLLATGNKSELATGYCTLYGDMCGGLAVIGDVPKRLVYAISRWINREREVIPQAILDKVPSAELRPNQTDQDSLPPYDVVDRVLQAYVEDRRPIDEIIAMGLPEAQVWDVVRRVDHNEYKRRQAAPGLKITCKAFSTGWRMPIAAKKSPSHWVDPHDCE